MRRRGSGADLGVVQQAGVGRVEGKEVPTGGAFYPLLYAEIR